MIHTSQSLAPICHRLHAKGHKLVLVTGFFDLLHQEHLNFLKKAKELGDTLLVGVESDARARQLKGEGRPVETQTLRIKHLTPYADYVFALPDDFSSPAAHRWLIKSLRPEYLAVSSHTAHQDKKRTLVEEFGGQLVVVHNHNPNISTTQLIQSKSS